MMQDLEFLEKLSQTALSPKARKNLKDAFKLIMEAIEEEDKIYKELQPVLEDLAKLHPDNPALQKLLNKGN